MPITVTQDIWKTDAIDVRHIDPSILEGEHLITSVFGPDSAKNIERYAPTFLQPPTISGNFLIPNRLTCSPGVISASPAPSVFYQWRADGVDIPGEDNQWIDTVIAYDQVELTCYVDVVNQLGTANAETNGITAERLEPLRMEEAFHMAITGISQKQMINNMRSDVLITSGIAQYDRLDFISAPLYIMTGMWVDLRDDVMTHSVMNVSGLGAVDRTAIKHEVYGTEWDTHLLSTQIDMAVLDWNVLAGDLTAYTSVANVQPQYGAHVFAFTYDGLRPDGFVELVIDQTHDIDASLLTDIDADVGVYCDFRMLVDSYLGFSDHLFSCTIQILDTNDVELSNVSIIGHNHDDDYGAAGVPLLAVPIPVNARKFKHTVVLYKTASAGEANINVFYEGTLMEFYKPTI